jgi:hypothetical protein
MVAILHSREQNYLVCSNTVQVFFYKRAQIFVADVYGAFAGEGIGSFGDIDQLTMFADYRVRSSE